MKQVPISVLSAIVCSKSKDKVFVWFNLLIRSFLISEKEETGKNKYIEKK